MKHCLDMRKETVTSTWQKGNILKGDSILDKMDFCGWLNVDQRWTAPMDAELTYCAIIVGCHLSAVPQLCHHLRFYTKHSEGSFGFRTNTQNERLLGFQISLEKAGSVSKLSRSSWTRLDLQWSKILRCASKYPLIWFHNLLVIWL